MLGGLCFAWQLEECPAEWRGAGQPTTAWGGGPLLCYKNAYNPNPGSSPVWQSTEILNRGNAGALPSGLFVALPSGVGVALAITGGGVNALVGVAISAALLPPIVMSGLCLVIGLWHRARAGDAGDRFVKMSGFSMLLFGLNFVCIFLMAFLTFKMKQIRTDTAESRTLMRPRARTQRWLRQHPTSPGDHGQHGKAARLLDGVSYTDVLESNTDGRAGGSSPEDQLRGSSPHFGHTSFHPGDADAEAIEDALLAGAELGDLSGGGGGGGGDLEAGRVKSVSFE